jgi:hypothetical protein
MKKLLLLSFLLWNAVSFGQFDTLVLVNGSRKAVILKEIGDKDVKYKLPADSLGNTYVIKKKMIEKFILKSGCIDLKEQGYENCEKDPTFGVIQDKDFSRVIVSTDIMQFTIRHFQVNTEYILKNRKAGLEFFYNIHFSDEFIDIRVNPVRSGGKGNYYKYNYYGFNIKIYPYAHKKATYWLAFGSEMGKATTKITANAMIPAYWDPYIFVPLGAQTTTKYETNYYGYHINTGFNFRPSKHFILQTNIGLGLNQFINPLTKKADISAKYSLGLMLGFAL